MLADALAEAEHLITTAAHVQTEQDLLEGYGSLAGAATIRDDAEYVVTGRRGNARGRGTAGHCAADAGSRSGTRAPAHSYRLEDFGLTAAMVDERFRSGTMEA